MLSNDINKSKRMKLYKKNPIRKDLCYAMLGVMCNLNENKLVLILTINGWLMAMRFSFELYWVHLIWKYIWYGMEVWKWLICMYWVAH